MVRMAEEARYQELVRERDEAEAAYMAEIKAAPPVRERTKEQQAKIDALLLVRQNASKRIWHYNIL